MTGALRQEELSLCWVWTDVCFLASSALPWPNTHTQLYIYYPSEQKHRCVQKIQMWDGNVTNLQMITHLAKLSDLYSVQS